MTMSPYNPKYIALSQGLLIAFSLVNSFEPKYFFEFYILYFIVIIGITSVMFYRNNPMLRDRKYMSEAVKARTLYEEKSVENLINSDKEFLEETMRQAGKMMKNLFIYFIFIIAIYILYSEVLSKVINGQGTPLYRFVIFLVFYEVFYGISFLLYRTTGMTSAVGSSMAMAPRSYKITDSGVVATDRSGTTLHIIHLQDAEINVNREKKFVEIKPDAKKGIPYKLRLYTNDVDKVSELLNRLKNKKIPSKEEKS